MRVVAGGFCLAEQRGDAVVLRDRAGADEELDDGLQSRLHAGRDGDEVVGPSGGEDQLRRRRRLVLDVDVVVGDELTLVRLGPVEGLIRYLVKSSIAAELGRVGQCGRRAEHVPVARRAHRLHGRQDLGGRRRLLIVDLLLDADDGGIGRTRLQRRPELLEAHVDLLDVLLRQAGRGQRAEGEGLLRRPRRVGHGLAPQLGDLGDAGLRQQVLGGADRQVHRDRLDGEPGLDRQGGRQVSHVPDVDLLGREAGIDEGSAVELDEVDLERRGLGDAGVLKQCLQLLILVTDVEDGSGGDVRSGAAARRGAARAPDPARAADQRQCQQSGKA